MSTPFPLGACNSPVCVTAMQARLGDEAFEAARAEGRAMAPEQAVAYALDEQPSK